MTKKEWIKDNIDHIKEYRKQYREKNKERIRALERERYQRNKDTILERQKKNRTPYKDWSEERKNKSKERNKRYYEQHKQERNDINKRYRWENGIKIALTKKKHWLFHKYKITLEQYHELEISQNGVCAICHKKETRKGYTNLVVDHDHETSKVRGLLCDKCNRGLGYFDENIDFLVSAIEYLKSTKSPSA